MPSFSAVVVAAGNSTRFKSDVSKQLTFLQEKPLFLHTLERLLVLPLSEIILVIREVEREPVEGVLKSAGLTEKVKIAIGGKRRQDSVANGIRELYPCSHVLIHDGARPFLSADFLNELIAEAQKFSALVPGIPMIETIKEIDREGKVVKTHDRTRFMRIQTPQIFEYKSLMRVQSELADSEIEFTDDAAMFEHLGLPVQVCKGSTENIKVTTAEDLRGLPPC